MEDLFILGYVVIGLLTAGVTYAYMMQDSDDFDDALAIFPLCGVAGICWPIILIPGLIGVAGWILVRTLTGRRISGR